MNSLSKSFHLLVAVAIAIPLGEGGVCCCLLDGPQGEAQIALELPTRSCCPQDEAASPITPPSCPSESNDDDCDCSAHGSSLSDSAVTTGRFVLSTLELDGLAPVQEDVSWPSLLCTGFSSLSHPPPKIPIYRDICVLLC